MIDDGALRKWNAEITKFDEYGMMFSIYFKVIKAMARFYLVIGILSIPVMLFFFGGTMFKEAGSEIKSELSRVTIGNLGGE